MPPSSDDSRECSGASLGLGAEANTSGDAHIEQSLRDGDAVNFNAASRNSRATTRIFAAGVRSGGVFGGGRGLGGLAIALYEEAVVVLGLHQAAVIDVPDRLAVGEAHPVADPRETVGNGHLAAAARGVAGDVVDKANLGAPRERGALDFGGGGSGFRHEEKM